MNRWIREFWGLAATCAALALIVRIGVYCYDGSPFTWEGYIASVVGIASFFVVVTIGEWAFDGFQRLLCGEIETWRAFGIQTLFVVGVLHLVVPRTDTAAGRDLLGRLSGGTLTFLGIALVVTALLWGQRVKSATTPKSKFNTMVATTSSRGGEPSLSWTQEVGTGETWADHGVRVEWSIMKFMMLGGTGIGFFSGGLQGAMIGGVIGALLAGMVPRDASMPILGGGGFAARAPRQVSEQQRRAEAAPITRFEDCEVFLERTPHKILFCIARGDTNDGPLPVVVKIPYDSFSNFEEGSHKAWFRERDAVDALPDWGVIIAQTVDGHVVRVAESVGSRAMLIDLLGNLQKTFIKPRPAMLLEFEEARRRAGGQPPGEPLPGSGPAGPKPTNGQPGEPGSSTW
jgi:hypothetical protein